MMKRIIPVLAIVLAGSLSFAQMHHGQGKDGKKIGGKESAMNCPGKGMGDKMGPCHECMGFMKFDSDKLLKSIGVSDKERTTIRETLHKMNQGMMDIHFKIREAHMVLRDEYAKQDLDGKVIDDLNGKIASLHRSKVELMLTTTKTIMQQLTPEQRTRLAEHKEGKMGRKGGGAK